MIYKFTIPILYQEGIHHPKNGAGKMTEIVHMELFLRTENLTREVVLEALEKRYHLDKDDAWRDCKMVINRLSGIWFKNYKRVGEGVSSPFDYAGLKTYVQLESILIIDA